MTRASGSGCDRVAVVGAAKGLGMVNEVLWVGQCVISERQGNTGERARRVEGGLSGLEDKRWLARNGDDRGIGNRGFWYQRWLISACV